MQNENYKDKIGERFYGVSAVFDGVERLDSEMAAVAGESDPKSDLVRGLYPVHLTYRRTPLREHVFSFGGKCKDSEVIFVSFFILRVYVFRGF